MLYIIAILAYLAVAVAHTAAMEWVFEDSAPWMTLSSLVWPLAAPFIWVKLVLDKHMECIRALYPKEYKAVLRMLSE